MATIVHAVIGYVFLTILIRVLTRRPGGQMTLFEFVLVFLVGGVIILSTVGDDKSVTNCSCAVITVGLMHRAVSYLKVRSQRFSDLVDGTPIVLVRRGEWQNEMLAKMNLASEDVMAAARLNGVRTPEEIDYAILERNGGINVMKKQKEA